jgi:hypothetical protein
MTTKRIKVNKKETLPDGTIVEITDRDRTEFSIEEFDFSLLGLSNEQIKKNYKKDASSEKQ